MLQRSQIMGHIPDNGADVGGCFKENAQRVRHEVGRVIGLGFKVYGLVVDQASSLSLTMGLTTILTTICLCPPKYAHV